MKISIFVVGLLLLSQSASAQFEEQELNRRLNILREDIQRQIIEDSETVRRAELIRRQNRIAEANGRSIAVLHPSYAEAEERMSVRAANQDSCLSNFPATRILEELQACHPHRAYTTCQSARETAVQAINVSSDRRLVVQANSPGSRNAVSNSVTFWNTFVDEANAVKASFRLCEQTMNETIYSQACMDSYDRFFTDSDLVQVLRNSCHPDSIDSSLQQIVNTLTRGGHSGLSQAQKAVKAKEFYNEARIEGMKVAEALFSFHQYLVETFPDQFGTQTARNDN